MSHKLRHIFLYSFVFFLAILSMAGQTVAQDIEDSDEPNDSTLIEEESRLMREGPIVIENGEESDSLMENWESYPFIHYSSNVIQMNGDDWTDLGALLTGPEAEVFSFVHIGDSHLQADIATSRLRKTFQKNLGNAGRGLIVPFRLSGTNEPLDYRFTLNCKATTSRLMKRPWTTDVGFTGVGVTPQRHDFELTIESLDENPGYFRFLRLFVSGDGNIGSVKGINGMLSGFTVDKNREEGYIDVFLDRNMSNAVLDIYSASSITIHGVMLSSERPGVFYHVIGNNGATFSTYNGLESFGESLVSLYPDLVIISLGTNEAFGKISDEEFYTQIDNMVSSIRRNNPEAKILLTTPKECQRRKRTGRRSRSRAYERVENCKRLRDVILAYCRDNSVPVYDWYEIAGGEGASDKWLNSQLLSSDRVHNTKTGYELFGGLFHSALERALTN